MRSAAGLSTCCSAPVYHDSDICSNCKEHCDIEPIEIEEENEQKPIDIR